MNASSDPNDEKHQRDRNVGGLPTSGPLAGNGEATTFPGKLVVVAVAKAPAGASAPVIDGAYVQQKTCE